MSSIGTSLGEILSFTTPSTQPVVTTLAATSVGLDGGILNGNANPNGLSTSAWFRYSTTNPGTCNDTFGTRTPSSGGTALGAGTTTSPFTATLSGLPTGVTYYYCAIAQNALGTALGSVLSFTTTAAPSVATTLASSVTATGATLEGSANPNAVASTGWFRYSATSPGSCNDTFGTRAPTSGATALGAGSASVPYTPRDHRAHRRHHVLLLRHRLERIGHGLRRRPLVHHAGCAHGHHRARLDGHQHLGVVRGDGQSQPRGRHRLLPLRDHQPGDVQRHLRDARPLERGHGAGSRIEPRWPSPRR
jgi:hypothetical protein